METHMSFECCACRAELVVVKGTVTCPAEYSDHDDLCLCQLTKYRCNQLECQWCDMVDAGLLQSEDFAKKQRSFYDFKNDDSGYRPSRLLTSGYGSSWKMDKPKPPSAEPLDLPTSWVD